MSDLDVLGSIRDVINVRGDIGGSPKRVEFTPIPRCEGVNCAYRDSGACTLSDGDIDPRGPCEIIRKSVDVIREALDDEYYMLGNDAWILIGLTLMPTIVTAARMQLEMQGTKIQFSDKRSSGKGVNEIFVQSLGVSKAIRQTISYLNYAKRKAIQAAKMEKRGIKNVSGAGQAHLKSLGMG